MSDQPRFLCVEPGLRACQHPAVPHCLPRALPGRSLAQWLGQGLGGGSCASELTLEEGVLGDAWL